MAVFFWFLIALLILPISTMTPAVASTGAQDLKLWTPEVIVSAHRSATTLDESTASVSIFNRKEIEQSGKRTVAELLREVPGLTVLNPGGQGQLSQIYLRGMPSGQTLVLLDGIKLNDPLNPERFFDFANFTLADIERIEVVRGTQSVVHGSDAIGGVIQIFSRKGKSPLETRASVIAGSFGTLSTHLQVGGTQGPQRYALGIERQSATGFSVASPARGATETDSRESVTVSSSTSRAWNYGGETQAILRFQYARTNLDAFDGTTTLDDPDFVTRERNLQARIQHTFEARPSIQVTLAQNLGFSRRVSDNPPPSLGATTGQFYTGDRFKTEATSTLELTPQLSLLLVSELERELGEFSDGFGTTQKGLSQEIQSLGSELRWKSGSLGVRWDGTSLSGSAWSARASQRYGLGELMALKGSLGTGFKIPTLYQRFVDLGGGAGGNPWLKPERSASVELGFEAKSLDNSLRGEFTIFRVHTRDQIEFPTTRYINIGKTEIEGAELYGHWRLGTLQLRGSGTTLWLARLPQRPRLQFSLSPRLEFQRDLSIEAELRHTGTRQNASPRVELPSYTVLNWVTRWQWGAKRSLFARIENALDRLYEEALGYSTARRSFFLGLESQF